MQTERNYFMQLYKWKLDSLTDIIKIARDYYSDPTEMNLAHWNLLKRNLSKEYQSFADIRMNVQRIPDYCPHFTIALVLLQVLMLTVLCVQYDFSDAGLVPEDTVREDIPTFLGTETFTSPVESNIWLGPPIRSFIEAGAVIASCMRPLKQQTTSKAKHKHRAMNEKNREYFGCCEMASPFNTAGTTTEAECKNLTYGLGKWTRGVWCSERSVTEKSVAHVIKPCCSGFSGECYMCSQGECDNMAGVFHSELDHCVQVNCLKEMCKLADSSTDETPWMLGPNTRWQWWRYLTAIPLTYGIIHILTLTFVQLFVMLPLEMCVGWPRVVIAYVGSSVVGEMVANTMEPVSPHVGSTSGVAGILAVAVLEVCQAWNFLQYPLLETIKLLSIILFISFLGTWPLISLASFLTGLITGAILGFVVIPYIIFGDRRGYIRARLVFFGFILIILGVVFLQWFLPFLETCEFCHFMECLPHKGAFSNVI
ncbi:unnamed protein product [Candidula unifasciata]|uniref:Peptidase S54 rhomboid domain-containing protein n=1 Tax=Candidula unifasciata TaxID=100452 RepID=A0A8S3Z427_9EUPU|nr:unnamed protein product [Candidula unifasciata]